MGISAAGLGSGLDINGLVSQLMSAESRPLSLLKTQQKAVGAKLSAYGQLSSVLANLQTALKGLSASGLSATSASSSSTALTVSAGTGATPGSYAVAVTQLAQSHKLTSPGQASDSADLGAGTLTISVAGGAPVTLAPASNSLRDLRDAINASGLAVTASLVNDGSASGHRLVIAGRDSGAGKTIALTGSGALAAFSYDPAAPVAFAYDAGGLPPSVMSQTQAAQDAQLTVDGLKISSATNTVAGAIAGVTLQLAQVTATPATLTVARDAAGVKNAVNTFVKSYNELRTLVGTQTAFNDATRTGAALHGDSGPRSILTQLRSTMTAAVGGAGSLDVLSDIGLSFQKDGSLTVNDAKLQTAIDTVPADLKALFAGSDGVATRLGTQLTAMLGEQGAIGSRTEGLNATQRRLSQRETSLQARLDAIESRYRAQFTRLDAALARMQGTSSYLSQQLSALANL